jgi:DNA primase
VRVLRLSGAKDPDEYIKNFGRDSFNSVLLESKSSFDYKVEKILALHDVSQSGELIKASAAISTVIAELASGVEREICISSAAKRLGVSAEALKTDVERLRKRKAREYSQKQSQEAYMTVKNINDRINPEASKNIKATSAEELVLGLMLIYPEYRSAAASGAAGLTADDFATEFSRRVFSAICELEKTEAGFSKAMLGQSFSVDEIGRIESIEQKRHALATNTKEVFEEGVRNLKDAKNNGEDSDINSIFEKKRLEMKKLRESKSSK